MMGYKILAIERIMQNNPNGVTTKQIIEKLDNQYGVKAERKAIYDNINVLTRFMPIEKIRKGNRVIYALMERG